MSIGDPLVTSFFGLKIKHMMESFMPLLTRGSLCIGDPYKGHWGGTGS